MKKIAFFIVTLFLLSACAVNYKMNNTYNGFYNQFQIDSICYVEKIPSPIYEDKWMSIQFIDDETGAVIEQLNYIRNTKENKKKFIEESFTCTNFDTIFKFQKRVLIKEKK